MANSLSGRGMSTTKVFWLLLVAVSFFICVAGRRTRNIHSNGIPEVVEEFNNEAGMPRFAEPIQNVTVRVGRDALLACVVDNLRGYMVTWARLVNQTILLIHHIVTQNPRITLSYNDHRSWHLHIKNVQETDRGWYMCQVNTDPMRMRQGYLEVVVPPSIVEKETSSDMVVREEANVTLTCKVVGYPEPIVVWRREDDNDFDYNGKPVNVVDGEVLHMTKVSRLHMGAYLCMSSNGVPPAISKRIMLRVQGRRTRNIESNGIPSPVEEFNNEALMPRFAEPIQNVTVTVGRDALLACVVDNLRGYKDLRVSWQVAWVRVDTQTILSIHHNVITQNPRITLSYNDHRSWYLHIKNVQETDRGWYMCQVNTDPMRMRQGYLQVVVPPSIVDKETSTDMVVREAANVTLTCKAVGYPEPYVMWRREDGEDINYNGEPVNVVDGEVLHITKVSRLHMGAYLCIASNGVPPSISKRVMLRVQFPPMLSIPNQLEGAYVGQDVQLECHTEAYPTSINYWTTERGDMIVSDLLVAGDKYEAVSMDNGYNKYMMLKIRSVSRADFGSYQCVAKNSLGETDGLIKLDEIPAPSTTTTSTAVTPIVPNVKKKLRTNKMKAKTGKQRLSDNQVLGDYDATSSNAEWQAPGDYPEGFSSKSPPVGLDSGTTMRRLGSSGYQHLSVTLILGSFIILFR